MLYVVLAWCMDDIYEIQAGQFLSGMVGLFCLVFGVMKPILCMRSLCYRRHSMTDYLFLSIIIVVVIAGFYFKKNDRG